VFSRADLLRTVAVVGALLAMAVTTNASAREFRAADTQSEDYPTVQALRYMGRLIEEKTDGRWLGLFGEPGVNVLELNLALVKLGGK